MSDNSGFSVLDLANEYASNTNSTVTDLFQHKNESVKKEEISKPVESTPSTMWVPDSSLTEGMDELSSDAGVVFDAAEVQLEETHELKNMLDEDAKKDAIESMDEMSRKLSNIEEAKKRNGIAKLKVPEGPYQVKLYAAAGDTNFKRAQKNLDEILQDYIKNFPFFILEWLPGYGDNIDGTKTVENGKIDPNGGGYTPSEEKPVVESNLDEIKVTVDQNDVSKIAWKPEELEKIKKSKTIELNIVEKRDLNYHNVKHIRGNAVDSVLMKYHRKVGSITAPLPASKYVATFTGLSYTETLDLQNSIYISGIDAEMKKWSLAFEHIKNPSIGEWREYKWYINPNTNEKVELNITDPDPLNIDTEDIHVVTKFQDFLMKTSMFDIQFILWKVICATSAGREILSLTCHAYTSDNKECGKSHEWLYDPNDMLIIDEINPGVLDDMDKTRNAAGTKAIMENYETSLVNGSSAIELHDSGIILVFGHASAFDYLDSIYAEIEALKAANENDPTRSSRNNNNLLLTSIKYFDFGEDGIVDDVDGIVKVLDSLSTADYATIAKMIEIVIFPYQFRFSIRDIICPACHNRSSMPIADLQRLIFIVAQSMESVDVTLTKL